MIKMHLLVLASFGIMAALTSLPVISNDQVLSVPELVIPIDARNKIIGVSLSDIVSNYPKLIPGLANVLEMTKKSPANFFKQNKIKLVHDIYLSKIPEINGGVVRLNLLGFVKYKNESFDFEKIVVTYNQGAKTLGELTIDTEMVYPLKDMMFSISVGLVERKAILEDSSKDIKIVFPIGVGAFDEGVMNEGHVSLVTPRFTHGFIDQRGVISKRVKPRYFKGLPFIRILKGDDLVADSTAIGFHIEINKSFVRGFDSHGCMRLREKDLMSFHDLIIFGDQQQTPITVQYRTKDPADHPAKKINTTYKTILNSGNLKSPFFIYDRDNLVQMVYKENSQAPISKLLDLAGDNYYDLFDYETLDQINEQNTRRKNECDAKVMSGELSTDNKKFQECLNKGKRESSFKDSIYRKYMGIGG